MATLFREEHQQADVASRRLQIAFWLGALASYLTYSLACALTLFGVSPIIAALRDGPHTFSSLYLHISLSRRAPSVPSPPARKNTAPTASTPILSPK